MSNVNYEERDDYSSVDENYDSVDEFELAEDQNQDQDNKTEVNAALTSSMHEPFSLTLTRSEDHEGCHFSYFYCRL